MSSAVGSVRISQEGARCSLAKTGYEVSAVRRWSITRTLYLHMLTGMLQAEGWCVTCGLASLSTRLVSAL